MKQENHQLFDSVEFDQWATLNGLYPDERVLLEKYRGCFPKEGQIVDAGTGGGRGAFALSQLGFRRVAGIDTSPRLIEAAIAKNAQKGTGEAVEFSVQSVCDLSFPGNSCGGMIAFQQLLSLLEEPADRIRAMQEFYRVLVPGGILMASFLNWNGRNCNPWLAAAIAPIKFLKGERDRRKRNYLCWLRRGGKPNLTYPFTRQPYIYWFEKEEIEELVTRAGFQILEIASEHMLLKPRERRGPFEFGGAINVVAQKPFAADGREA